MHSPCDTLANNSVDPLFCDPENGDFTLQEGSPGSAEMNPCGQIGAFGVACINTLVEATTWGRLKTRFAH